MLVFLKIGFDFPICTGLLIYMNIDCKIYIFNYSKSFELFFLFGIIAKLLLNSSNEGYLIICLKILH